MKKLLKSQELQYANEIFVKIVELLEALVEHMGIPRMLSKPDKIWSLTVEGAQHLAVGSFSFLIMPNKALSFSFTS